MSAPLLQIEDLTMHFPVRGGVLRRQVATVHAVDGIRLSVEAGQTLGLVGESGCGKTTVGRCIVGLYKPTAGRVRFDGRNIAGAGAGELKKIRRDLQMIFQDPFESLNPRHTVGEILGEPFDIHRIGTSADRAARVQALMERVGMDPGAVDRFPHEFSGGQRQRIGIARAIALNPRLVVCDEPVSALDVSIQSQILNLLLKLQQEMGLAYLFIAHDLAVVKHVSDRIAVMYLGKIVEQAPAETLYRNPLHPYTVALIAAIPEADPFRRKVHPLLGGDVPSPLNPPPGCRFHPRCPIAIQRCREEAPMLKTAAGGDHLVACHRAGELRLPDTG
ncbi:MAG: dipeptide ABC transporter ATP-binding protein [Desulfobacterales bacterium]|jgi:oligopeptide/dipeptide ABC transporter ATP-binding protein|nr:dipeptide ABC transporter ATP-binding protein [Desulfobacterales bacterium]